VYLDALSLLEDERDAWRPFERLGELSDDQLERPVEAVNGWSGRDLMAHLIAWQLVALDVAKELAVGERSATKARADADWEARGGDVVNDEIQRLWAARPIDEVRAEFERVSGELRGYLTVVPEARWIKDADNQRFFIDETLDHYDEHRPDLDAILAAVAP
jgi:Mycothiol maleylpyruvate isomerase N-terminal domain